jgi:hydrophobe/amphiphile efflux-1 (HAE1) family protein
MKNISSWSIRNPIPIILLFTLLTLAGILGFQSMRINNNPDVDLPLVLVSAARPGAAPSELESQVTRPIEDAIAGLGSVRHINSTVGDGSSTTFIEFELGVDQERVTNDVRNAMSGVRSQLPQDMQEPTVQRIDVSGDSLIDYVVSSPTMTPEQLSWFVDNDVSRALLAVKGVAEVNRAGGVSREIRLELDPNRLAAQGVTAAQVSQAMVSANSNLPGGRVTVAGSERSIRTLGSAGSIEQLRETRLALGDGRTVRLGDLGEVLDSWSEPRTLARYEGRESVTFGFKRSRGASEVDVAQKVREVVAKMDAANPNVSITQVSSNVEYIEESYIASLEALLFGAVLAVAVVFLFLRDWRATAVTAVAIPMSLIPTFAVLAPAGQSLNGVTLLALSLTIGILVDDAIVEIENIVRHMRGGKAPYPAAMEAADEIGLAVVATTFTIVAVFAPTGFMPGIVGQFFKAFALAASISVLFSLLVARTLTPLMGAYFLKNSHHVDKDPPWMNGYLRALNWALDNRWKVVVAGTVLFIGSVMLIPALPFEFSPAGDRGKASIAVQLPPGATLRETDQVVQRVSRELEARPEVVSTYASIGGSGVNTATVVADMVERGKRDVTQQEFTRQMIDALAVIPGARISEAQNNQGGPGGGTTFSVSLLSDDGPALMAAARKVETEMRGVSGLTNVINTAAIARPEILVTPKADQAALLGVSTGAISQAVRVATIGDVDQALPKFNLGDRQIPIRILLNQQAREDLSVIENLRVPTATGQAVPLSAVADVTFGAGPSTISRQDRSRVATITAEMEGLIASEAAAKVQALPALKNLPPTVRQVPAGDQEFMQDLLIGFLTAFATGIVLMYVVLVLLFKSFTHPVTIMAALPLAIGGAFAALLLGGSSFSISSLIGILMLMGIAAKNSILLVDYAIEARAAGLGRREALIDSAHKRSRPILMTTVAMGAGMAPVALGFGADVEFRSPMAIAVIGGLITSTLLSLLYIPAIFTIVDDISSWGQRHLASRFAGQKELTTAPVRQG